MSTKIYNGWRYVDPDGGRPDPFVLLEQLRVRIPATLSALHMRRVVGLAVGVVDGTADLDEMTVGAASPLIAAEQFVGAAGDKIRATGRRDPVNDFSCEVTMLTDPDDPSHLLVLVYCEQDLADDLAAIAGLTEFRYWDNTDRPDSVSVDEWAARRDAWDRSAGWDAPGSRGLTWTAPSSAFHWFAREGDDMKAALLDAAPTREVRARRIAIHEATSQLAAADDSAEGAARGGSTSELVGRINDAMRGAVKDTDRLAAIAEGLADITYEQLIGRRQAQPAPAAS